MKTSHYLITCSIISFSFAALADHDMSYVGLDSVSGEECRLVLEDERYAYTTYTGESYFSVRKFYGGSPRSGCGDQYGHCLYGPPINDATGTIDESVEYDLFVAFDCDEKPLYFELTTTTFNSTLDKKCEL